MNEIERERKFLVKSLPPEIEKNLNSSDYIDIDQGYTQDGLRVRREIFQSGEERYTIIKKLLTRHAATKIEAHPFGKIDKKIFEKYWPLTRGKRISKKRFLISLGELEAHLDVFISGVNDGKMLVEVEFPENYDMDSFNPPDWFGREVTEELTNRDLAEGKTIPAV
jgi:adenylate cyclase